MSRLSKKKPSCKAVLTRRVGRPATNYSVEPALPSRWSKPSDYNRWRAQLLPEVQAHLDAFVMAEAAAWQLTSGGTSLAAYLMGDVVETQEGLADVRDAIRFCIDIGACEESDLRQDDLPHELPITFLDNKFATILFRGEVLVKTKIYRGKVMPWPDLSKAEVWVADKVTCNAIRFERPSISGSTKPYMQINEGAIVGRQPALARRLARYGRRADRRKPAQVTRIVLATDGVHVRADEHAHHLDQLKKESAALFGGFETLDARRHVIEPMKVKDHVAHHVAARDGHPVTRGRPR